MGRSPCPAGTPRTVSRFCLHLGKRRWAGGGGLGQREPILRFGRPLLRIPRDRARYHRAGPVGKSSPRDERSGRGGEYGQIAIPREYEPRAAHTVERHHRFLGVARACIRGRLKPEQIEYIRLIHQSGEHLHNVINDILDLAKVDAGKFELHEEERVDPRAIVDSTVTLMRSHAIAGEIRLSTEIQGPLPALICDSTRLKQILLNLVSNALKFTERGGSVVVAVRGNPDGSIVFEVRDTGFGMTAEEIDIALQPFGQVDSGHTRRYEGTGLGLPLAQKLAELHGGSLGIQSEKGRGTTVTVTLPLSRVVGGGAPADSLATAASHLDE